MDKNEITVAEYFQRIDERQKSIENLILSRKKVLTFSETAIYTGLSESHLYKLTSAGKIPFYRPRGKMIYFDGDELDSWLLQNRVATADEIAARACSYDTQNRRRSAR